MSKLTYLTRTKITQNYVRYDGDKWCIYLPRFMFDAGVPFPVKIDVYAMNKLANTSITREEIWRTKFSQEEAKNMRLKEECLAQRMRAQRAEALVNSLSGKRVNDNIELALDDEKSFNVAPTGDTFDEQVRIRREAAKKGWVTRRNNARKQRRQREKKSR